MAYKSYQDLEYTKNSAFVLNQTHAELDIFAAEAAFATENVAISRHIVENFFRRKPQKDSFYCRAKLTLALILDYEARDSNGDESIALRKIAINEVKNEIFCIRSLILLGIAIVRYIN